MFTKVSDSITAVLVNRSFFKRFKSICISNIRKFLERLEREIDIPKRHFDIWW